MRVLHAFSVCSYHFIHVSLCLFSSFCHSPLSLYYVCHLVLSIAADEILTSFSFKTFIVVTMNKKKRGASGRLASSRPQGQSVGALFGWPANPCGHISLHMSTSPWLYRKGDVKQVCYQKMATFLDRKMDNRKK